MEQVNKIISGISKLLATYNITINPQIEDLDDAWEVVMNYKTTSPHDPVLWGSLFIPKNDPSQWNATILSHDGVNDWDIQTADIEFPGVEEMLEYHPSLDLTKFKDMETTV